MYILNTMDALYYEIALHQMPNQCRLS